MGFCVLFVSAGCLGCYNIDREGALGSVCVSGLSGSAFVKLRAV